MDPIPPSHDEGDSELELLADVEAPLPEVQIVLGVAPDGLPDPLATIAEMLPGGRATRGKPQIVYVPTRLDTDLVAALREREPTLVVLSGNAGDGKTAFLAQVIEAAGGPRPWHARSRERVAECQLRTQLGEVKAERLRSSVNDRTQCRDRGD